MSLCLKVLLLLVVGSPLFAAAQDADPSNKCSNNPRLVKVKYYIDGVETGSFSAVTAEFGPYPPFQKKSLRHPAVYTNPLNGCSNMSSKLNQSVALSIRGECDFTTKAKVAQSGGAAALVVINNIEGFDYMGCSTNDTDLNITIPILMIQRSAGDVLNKSMGAGKQVDLQIYLLKRSVFDLSNSLLWVISVGTLVIASVWSGLVGRDQSDERYSALSQKESSPESDSEDTLDINVVGAVVFVIAASVFLLLLYFFMSSWFVWVLIVLFCMGGVEGLHFCVTGLVLRRCRNFGQKIFEVASCWENFYSFSIRYVGEHSLCCLLGCDATRILLMDWSRYSWRLFFDPSSADDSVAQY